MCCSLFLALCNGLKIGEYKVYMLFAKKMVYIFISFFLTIRRSGMSTHNKTSELSTDYHPPLQNNSYSSFVDSCYVI